MHEHCSLVFLRFALPHFTARRVLEIGPDGVPSAFQRLAQIDGCQWHTLDLQSDHPVTYVSRGEYDFGIEDDGYDVVFSANVMEHVKRPWKFIRECARVCRPGGVIITICPANWPYHHAPVDCWRIYSAGMRALLEDCGLNVIFTWHGTLDYAVARETWGTVVDTIGIGSKPQDGIKT